MSYNTIEGKLDASGLKFAIVVARFNSFITERLLDGAIDGLVRHGAKEEEIDVVRVPGSWELPLAVSEVAKSGKYNAILCLGAVIRGDTPHFDYVAGEATKGVSQVSMQTGVPIAFGVLTTNTVEQAVDRAGAKQGNKGFDAAMTAIEMANVLKRLREKR